MICFDLCSGVGGASDGFKKADFSVVTLDINSCFNPDIVMDITKFAEYVVDTFYKIDVVWFSPPCDEFTLSDLPWHKELRTIK